MRLIAAVYLFLFFSRPQVDPHQISPHLKQGLEALNQGDLAAAQQELEQAEQADPKNVYVWTSLAQTHLRLGALDKAESAAAKARELGANNPVVNHALGIFYFDYSQALLRKQEFTHAADILTGALKANPDDARLVLALGVARYGQRRFDEAIDGFLKAVRLDASIEQSYLFLGKMLDQAGRRLPEITKDNRAWVTRAPDNARAAVELAKALLAADPHNAEAGPLLERSIELNSNDWESHFELGELLAGKREYAKAAAELERSIALDGRQAMPHYHLARVYDRLGKPDAAKSEREIHARLTGGGSVP